MSDELLTFTLTRGCINRPNVSMYQYWHLTQFRSSKAVLQTCETVTTSSNPNFKGVTVLYITALADASLAYLWAGSCHLGGNSLLWGSGNRLSDEFVRRNPVIQFTTFPRWEFAYVLNVIIPPPIQTRLQKEGSLWEGTNSIYIFSKCTIGGAKFATTIYAKFACKVCIAVEQWWAL